MAVTAITPVSLSLNTFNVDAITFTAPTVAADGFTVPFTGKDKNIVLLFQNTNAGTTARTATVKAGNGIQGVADLDSGDIAAAKTGAVMVDSGAFKNVSGTNKGKILIIPSHAELKMAAVVLP